MSHPLAPIHALFAFARTPNRAADWRKTALTLERDARRAHFRILSPKSVTQDKTVRLLYDKKPIIDARLHGTNFDQVQLTCYAGSANELTINAELITIDKDADRNKITEVRADQLKAHNPNAAFIFNFVTGDEDPIPTETTVFGTMESDNSPIFIYLDVRLPATVMDSFRFLAWPAALQDAIDKHPKVDASFEVLRPDLIETSQYAGNALQNLLASFDGYRYDADGSMNPTSPGKHAKKLLDIRSKELKRFGAGTEEIRNIILAYAKDLQLLDTLPPPVTIIPSVPITLPGGKKRIIMPTPSGPIKPVTPAIDPADVTDAQRLADAERARRDVPLLPPVTAPTQDAPLPPPTTEKTAAELEAIHEQDRITQELRSYRELKDTTLPMYIHQLEEMQAKLTASGMEKETLNSTIETLKTNLADARRASEAHRQTDTARRIVDLEAKWAKLDRDLIIARGEKVNLERAIAEKEATIRTQEEDLANLRARPGLDTEEGKRTQARVSQLENELASANVALRAARDVAGPAATTIQELQERLRVVTLEKDGLAGRISALQKANTSEIAEKNAAIQKANEIERNLLELTKKSNLKAALTEVQWLQTQVAAQALATSAPRPTTASVPPSSSARPQLIFTKDEHSFAFLGNGAIGAHSNLWMSTDGRLIGTRAVVNTSKNERARVTFKSTNLGDLVIIFPAFRKRVTQEARAFSFGDRALGDRPLVDVDQFAISQTYARTIPEGVELSVGGEPFTSLTQPFDLPLTGVVTIGTQSNPNIYSTQYDRNDTASTSGHYIITFPPTGVQLGIYVSGNRVSALKVVWWR